MAITEVLIAEGAVTTISKFTESAAKWYMARKGFLACSLVNRNQEARAVRSALVCIRTEDGLYPLVKNLHRPESLAPFGGVYKYLPGAEGFLNEIEFTPHFLGTSDDSTNDLRGFLKRKYLSRFSTWAERGIGRENANDCIYRELAEELKEASIKLRVPTLRLIRLRTVAEPPTYIESVGYTQYRVFDVLSLDMNHTPSRKFVHDLSLKARRLYMSGASTDVELVTPAEIREGRSNRGRAIAHHSNYFFGSQQGGWVAPPFPRNIGHDLRLLAGEHN